MITHRQTLLVLLSSVILQPPILSAAVLKSEVYLSRPWGVDIGEVGRFLPGPQDDQYAQSISGFAVNSEGAISVIDLWNKRIQIFSQQGQLMRLKSFDQLGGRPLDIDADASGGWIFAATVGAPGNKTAHILTLSPAGESHDMIPLSPLGIRLPLFIELGTKDDLFVQNNPGFETFHLKRSGTVIDQQKDDRLFRLLAKGLFTFRHEARAIVISTKSKEDISVYSDENHSFAVLGVTPSGQLYMYEEPHGPSGAPVLEGLDQDGRKLFSIQLKRTKPESLLNPLRYPPETRQVRMAADGFIYATDTPDANRFNLYRFKIIP